MGEAVALDGMPSIRVGAQPYHDDPEIAVRFVDAGEALKQTEERLLNEFLGDRL